MNFVVRKNCIFCENALNDLFFKEDLTIPMSCYLVDKTETEHIFMPYNIYTCSICKTSQTKYLGDLNIIYKYNHADSTGNIMINLHKTVVNLLLKHQDKINNIIEIGSAYGILSNSVLDNLKMLEKYYIIEPSFLGTKKDRQILIGDFFENVDNNLYKDANTLIMSHVFEHFYNPNEILEKIHMAKNITNVLLVWPDLECYKDNNTCHVLNTEHTYYIDNNFVKILFNNHNFELIEECYYENHSVIFLFKRNNDLIKQKLENINYSISNYYNALLENKNKIYDFIKKNKENYKKICIWPASVHSQFLMMCLNLNSDSIDFVLDNSPNKIGKFMYGYNIKCESFLDNCTNEKNAIILNGGCFNKEVAKLVSINNDQTMIL